MIVKNQNQKIILLNHYIKQRKQIQILKLQKLQIIKLHLVDIYNIETKYNRNTSKNNQIEYLEPIQELKKNLSNHSLKFCSEKKLLDDKK